MPLLFMTWRRVLPVGGVSSMFPLEGLTFRSSCYAIGPARRHEGRRVVVLAPADRNRHARKSRCTGKHFSRSIAFRCTAGLRHLRVHH